MQRQTGHTLLEAILVVTIIGIIAAVIVPTASPSRLYQLEHAATELATAIRYARNEAIRTTNPHGIVIDETNNQFKVFSLNTANNPPSPVYDVYHPVNKKTYEVDLSTLANAKVDAIALTSQYQGSCNRTEYIVFNKYGAAFCIEPWLIPYVKSNIRLSLDKHIININLMGISGTVTIQ